MFADEQPHVSVLADELIDLLDRDRLSTVVDCTFGAGGHARLVGELMSPNDHLYVIDRDQTALQFAQEFAEQTAFKVTVVRNAFAEGLSSLLQAGVKADAVYFDLGMSSMQIDTPSRGFSYMHDAPLDMRMGEGAKRTALELIQDSSQDELAKILFTYGEERFGNRIAAAIKQASDESKLSSTLQLSELVKSAYPVAERHKGSHPAKKTFQALRIAVNDELQQIQSGLETAWKMLVPGGVLLAISFHSLEDRLVKQYFSQQATGCICPPEIPVCMCGLKPAGQLMTRKAIKPSAAEISINPRSKSARLRGLRKHLLEESSHG